MTCGLECNAGASLPDDCLHLIVVDCVCKSLSHGEALLFAPWLLYCLVLRTREECIRIGGCLRRAIALRRSFSSTGG